MSLIERLLKSRQYAADVRVFSKDVEGALTQEIFQQIVAETLDYDKIIIICDKCSLQMKKLRLVKQHKDLDVFERAELALLLSGHSLLPTFSRIPAAEMAALDQKYGAHLPQMTRDDPMSKLHDYKEGEIIRIHRKDGTLYYRRIVDDE